MPEVDVYYTTMPSPIGELILVSNGEALTRLKMDAQRHGPPTGAGWRRDDGPFAEPKRQLEAYFARELTTFDLPLALDGTPFQRQVWAALQTIPYGRTVSYRDIAERIGNPKAVRAVGLTNGRNPIGIIVPCHRVIGADGSLTGYGGGLPRKRWLLQHEAHASSFMLTATDSPPRVQTQP